MVVDAYRLAQPPTEPSRMRLWLENVAGFIMMNDVLSYSLARMHEDADIESRMLALERVRDAVYGLCMIADGVSGDMRGREVTARVSISISLTDTATGRELERLELAEGDGACMGFHGWVQGDFGDVPITSPV